MVDALEQHGMLGANVRFLDIGCGCGRIARCLLEKPLFSYVGFDRHRGMIDWCQQEIGARYPKFNFQYFSIESAYQILDGQKGQVSAEKFIIPFEDGAFDSVLLASVFTHMPLKEIRHYLSEIYRVLSPRGAVLLSVFFSEEENEKLGSDGVDFHVPRAGFVNALEISRFYHTMVGTTGEHNWYIVRPLPNEKTYAHASGDTNA
jgi:SAM-dependent methyltransferase